MTIVVLSNSSKRYQKRQSCHINIEHWTKVREDDVLKFCLLENCIRLIANCIRPKIMVHNNLCSIRGVENGSSVVSVSLEVCKSRLAGMLLLLLSQTQHLAGPRYGTSFWIICSIYPWLYHLATVIFISF